MTMVKRSLKGRILWADDEIDHLRSHILFLEDRGYTVAPVTNGEDAVSMVKQESFDLILLDEMMTGMDGLQTLTQIHEINPTLPVVMITKSEEEDLMERAIGGKITDYLTKPVNPSQILSSCKRILEKNRIAQEKLTREYTMEFGEISSRLQDRMEWKDWIDIHAILSEREIDLDLHPDLGLHQTLKDQRKECNHAFGRYIHKNYQSWVQGEERPVLSVDLFKKYVIPFIEKDEPTLFIVVDNMRLDQWLVIEPLLYDLFEIDREHYFSIIPTATPYSRNALFAGLFPQNIEAKYPQIWKQGEDDESSRNRHELELLKAQLSRAGLDLKPEPRYVKILDQEEAHRAQQNVDSFLSAPLVAMVFNFVDILAHRRSESQILREIVPDESAYRTLTKNWFERSSLFHILKSAAASNTKIVLTSDHGSIRAMHGSTVHADRETSTNLRYKYGRGIRGESKHLIDIKDPKTYGLPARGMNTNYLIALEDYYFVYPTNYHRYLTLYRDSLQHGGVSLEEMILPVVTLRGRVQDE